MKFPDYQRGSLSITASILRHYGLVSNYPTLPELDRVLTADTRNVVLVLLDGMGENLLRRKLDAEAFLVKNDVAAISAVFPSTTTAATTSMWTGLSPQEHGWLGWTLYFKEAGRLIDTFLNRDTYTGETYAACNLAERYMPLPSAFAGMNAQTETHAIFPFPTYATQGAQHTYVEGDPGKAARLVTDICRAEGRHFVCLYCGEPDHTMHEKGVECPETDSNFARLNGIMEEMCARVAPETLVIITADHGLIDTTQGVELAEHPEICQCLWMPPSIESRAAAFFVKPHMRARFEAEFQALCGEDFLLMPREEVYSSHLLGFGTPHAKTDDFIGDYLAIATGSRYLHYASPASKPFHLIGQHAGLTEDEMTVPVIVIKK